MSKLKLGMIPAGTACPFIKECSFKVHNCPGYTLPDVGESPSVKRGTEGPSVQRTNTKDYSCAAARAWDMAEKLPQQKPSQE